ncbi:MAG: hypothetical protein OEW12_08260 [Deltaproteobacteria bacterium]|nr:hypothetical protein [Deltaproteobacteria bacterium]
MSAYRTYQNITLYPVFHSRLEFASHIRAALLADPPDRVAVELPATWGEALWRGVRRLPFLSVVAEDGEGGLFMAIEPVDPMIEAMRTATELAIPCELMDLDVDHYPMLAEPVPDTYPVHLLGYDAVMAPLTGQVKFARHKLDEARETMMAHTLQQLAQKGGRVAAVLGAAHLTGVLEKLKTPQPRPLGRAKPRSLKLHNWAEPSARESMSEAPFLAADYERARQPQGRTPLVFPMGAPLFPSPASAPLGVGHSPRRGGEEPDMAEMVPVGVDRVARIRLLLTRAAMLYQDHTHDRISLRQLRGVGEFARKYALVDGLLVPDLYQLTAAARGMVDDDFARFVWDEGTRYPWQDGSGHLPQFDVSMTEMYRQGRKMVLRGKLRHNRPRLRGVTDRERLREHTQAGWKENWSSREICSHVPEDLVIEGVGRRLMTMAKGMLSGKHSRVEPFSASMKDGVDIRETLRNWHSKELYVKDAPVLPVEVGSVVVIFDEDRSKKNLGLPPLFESRYSWLVTWLGEHEQESDMAFYATPSGENLVGPGISRCEYGGFVLSYPPLRMFDVWSDPYFDVARDKPERLLLAGLDYSTKRHVVYVAPTPPRSAITALAGRMGRQIVYIPLGQLSRDMLKKVRNFHVLAGKHVRDIAGEYIP